MITKRDLDEFILSNKEFIDKLPKADRANFDNAKADVDKMLQRRDNVEKQLDVPPPTLDALNDTYKSLEVADKQVTEAFIRLKKTLGPDRDDHDKGDAIIRARSISRQGVVNIRPKGAVVYRHRITLP
jgi:hypothetical protein